MNSQVYILTAVFNPFNFASRDHLYHNFARHMRDTGAKLFTIEAAFGDQPHRLTDPHDPMALQVRTDQVLFHKERMLNLGFKKLRHVQPDAKNVGWFDCDVTFLDLDWAAKSAHALQRVKVIQPFGQAINLNEREESMWSCPSSMRAFIDNHGYHQEPPMPVSATYKGHPGLAWMMRRAVWEQLGGLYDRCVAGSADTVMSNCFKGDWSAYLPCSPTAAMIADMQAYQGKCDLFVRGDIGFVHGALCHHWHGKSEQRGYEKRWSIASFHQFDPAADVMDDPQNGMLRWSGNKPKLEQDMRLSLSHRNEDGRV